jgi:hypothetical protein
MNRGRAIRSLGVAAVGWLAASLAHAQPFDAREPLVLVVGTPKGGARMARSDAARSGRAEMRLPATGLRTTWRTSVGFLARQGPLVDSAGRTYVVGDGGEVATLSVDGEAESHVATRASSPGPTALLSDDTLVFADAAGEAVAVRKGATRWRTRFGRPSPVQAAPLPLDDGGVVVASGPDLVLLDARGGERARVVLGEPIRLPLLEAIGKVVAIADSGTIWTWSPGAPDARRFAEFGTEIAAAATVAGGTALMAVARTGMQILSLDLATRSVHRIAGSLGGTWLGPAMVDGRGGLYLAQASPDGEWIVALDANGVERGRAQRTGPTHGGRVDAGGALDDDVAPWMVDDGGHVVFATASGAVGVATLAPDPAPGSVLEAIADVCPASGARTRSDPMLPPAIGIAPTPEGSLVAVCRSGLVVGISGRAAPGESDGGVL